MNDIARTEPTLTAPLAPPDGLPARRRARRPPWIAIALLAVVVAALALWWNFGRGGDAVAYRTVKVERGALTAVVSSSGTLNAVVNVLVGSQISGQVRDLY